jgi:5'-deoxynucleotidase YfbR-like HD superfamily hydrolase
MSKKPSRPKIDRLVALQELCTAFGAVERTIYVPRHKAKRMETDVEHSYALAMAAMYLAQFYPELDRERLLRYALIHDLVEVHAGDTYAFGNADSLQTKHEREALALTQLERDWPDFSLMTDSIKTYEAREDKESQFIYALDKLMPVVSIYLAEGQFWRDYEITMTQLLGSKMDKVKISPEVEALYLELAEKLIANPHYFHTEN